MSKVYLHGNVKMSLNETGDMALSDLIFLSAPFSVFLDAGFDAERHDFANERKGKGLLDRELDGAFRGNVPRKVFCEGFDGGARGIKANVMFEGAEHHQDAVVGEGRHAPLNFFDGTGS